ncbi:phytanoyl-CoA dioxygenase family protein [Pedobacter hiemivivus]|uniref:Phytanoyl-CoA dioxygenase n=1 Tax=Pedobacter hiemivivus TaxID=2530454 RepID=A0A4R0MRQ3_9SPHI|nr:phytanoyl-CoA dioxygenase family protein [Pedobacter hiemivivus]TCC89605.1 hypothetical protein EZ444_20975 [Pedobacter hiemivivus]
MINCNFSKLLYETHQIRKSGVRNLADSDFDHIETIWLGIYGLGKFETYFFLYSECRDFEHFIDWVTLLKGQDFVNRADEQFKKWQNLEKGPETTEVLSSNVLSAEQVKFWEENGYLRIPKVVDGASCDAVKHRICRYLNLHLEFPETWYIPHPDWQGIMLQLYQNEEMEVIRQDPHIFDIFAALYKSTKIIPNTEKLGYNPPETQSWAFRHGNLHWDLDLSLPVTPHIQALVYLDDVPVERGPLHLVPGFNNKFKDWIRDFSSLDRAHEYMRITERSVPVPGEKGDLILWQNTIPHAAGKNQSDLPRFVQYISFTKI